LKLTKYIVCCIGLSLFVSSLVEAQKFYTNTDAGFFGGTSYYLGDINPRKHFYAPDLSFGALLKHNFTEHHCLRANIFYGKLKGDDSDFDNDFQQNRGASFNTSLIDIQIGYEFNFLRYIVNRFQSGHTPYIFAGIGYSFIVSSTAEEAENHLTIPFGIGYKYRITPRIGVGCEWGLRKTFTDKLDGVLNPGPEGSYSRSHNNDWYSFAGIFVTFRIFEKNTSCPAYRQQLDYK
jgi:hypothetical protein